MAHLLIKFGGGLITDKGKLMSVDYNAIDKLSAMTRQLLDEGHIVTIVHGAGSFGHLKANEWKLALGADEAILSEQNHAVSEVRADMILLNSIICDSLNKHGVETNSHPPSTWASETGPEFIGNIDRFTNSSSQIVNVTFGDVVDCRAPKHFGILSGDDIMVRIGKEISDISHAIFLLGDTEGVLSAPPDNPDAALIDIWHRGDQVMGRHDSEMDVTGGIFLKVRSAELIAEVVEDVWLIDGRKPKRVLQLVESKATIGTRVTI